ncbi:Reverse transcriptase, RNA-dependent DNA polymerase [Dillenia turbinata]|uniref:Reverse transcriptase, RNA-dependent DNA polymerase n=1 Tax=Dillenia turbinata TaxID=194707 RepID=A0AAN8ZJQ5_9MAGN
MDLNIVKQTSAFYSKFTQNYGVIIYLYMEDLLIIGTNMQGVNDTKKYLTLQFKIKDLGEAETIFGIKGKKYSGNKILSKFNYLGIKEINTPYDVSNKLIENSERFTYNPSTNHWRVIRRVFGILKEQGPLSKLSLESLKTLEIGTSSNLTSSWQFLRSIIDHEIESRKRHRRGVKWVRKRDFESVSTRLCWDFLKTKSSSSSNLAFSDSNLVEFHFKREFTTLLINKINEFDGLERRRGDERNTIRPPWMLLLQSSKDMRISGFLNSVDGFTMASKRAEVGKTRKRKVYFSIAVKHHSFREQGKRRRNSYLNSGIALVFEIEEDEIKIELNSLTDGNQSSTTRVMKFDILKVDDDDGATVKLLRQRKSEIACGNMNLKLI